jgi:hypothetical protein
MSRDIWQIAAAHRLRQHVMRAVIRGRDYAPDQTRELSKAGKVGPISAQISHVLQQHADLWAQDMREARAADLEVDENGTWSAAMLEADVEIDRFLAGHKLTTGAAA